MTSLTLPVIQLPTIHINGTSPEMILDDNLKVRSLIQDALAAMQAMEFNQRDYYPVQGSWEIALAQRTTVAKSLQAASDYFLAIAEHASDIIAAKEARKARAA